MSLLRPKQNKAAPTKRSWGPCFVIVNGAGARFRQCIYSAYEPTLDQIRATAQTTVWKYQNAYGGQYHWEPYNESDEMVGHLRGQSALAEAKRVILDEPCDSPGQRFLRSGQKIGASFTLPSDVSEPIETTASRAMLNRLNEPIGQPSGPSPEFDLPMDPSDDDNWEAG